MKVIDSMWFNSLRGSFGFVLAEDEIIGERAIYAGIVSGADQEEDQKFLISSGARVNIPMLENLVSKLKAGK